MNDETTMPKADDAREGDSPALGTGAYERAGKAAAERKYDLEERTSIFGEAIISFAGKIKPTPVSLPLIGQIVRAGTSIGANYCEADDAVSKKDFLNKIATCRKESRETKYWLRMIVTVQPELKEKARPLWQEAKELNLIFAKIVRSGRS